MGLDGFFRGLEIGGSGLSAERLRMDVIAANIANAQATRGGPDGGPYRRRVVLFAPIVDQAMNEVGTARQYNELLGQAKVIPFLRTEDYDLDHYVVGKALDGLFHVVGEEERKIRTDPAARVTDLLKEVFAK